MAVAAVGTIHAHGGGVWSYGGARVAYNSVTYGSHANGDSPVTTTKFGIKNLLRFQTWINFILGMIDKP